MGFNKDKFMEFAVDEPISLFKPMKLKMVIGCMCDSLTVNNIEEMNLTDNQRKNIIHRIYTWYRKHPEQLNNLLQYFIESNCDTVDMSEKPCECCGDFVETYEMEI